MCGAAYLDAGKALPSAASSEEATEEETPDEEPQDSHLSDEEDYRCLAGCGYKSFEDLMASKCLVKCTCMEELVSSECFSKCPDSTRAAIEEARGDACREEAARRQRKRKH
ncbi:translocation protein sec62 [Cyclospora cayetanensis]|uniref:Translocation protein sec62 n=1 Tax=Cyclospora cayetanensis TaxID=88456 RepID=A0A1D3CW23_9EIME|nr:translocation protein sec62 [Cyclospora cayetanensis]